MYWVLLIAAAWTSLHRLTRNIIHFAALQYEDHYA